MWAGSGCSIRLCDSDGSTAEISCNGAPSATAIPGWLPMTGWWSRRYAVRLSGIVGPQGKVFAEVDLRLTMAVRR